MLFLEKAARCMNNSNHQEKVFKKRPSNWGKMIPINNASKYHRTVAAFGKMMSPTVAPHNLVFLSCMLLDKFLEKTVKTASEIADTSDETQYKWKELKKLQQVRNASERKWRSNREPGTRQ